MVPLWDQWFVAQWFMAQWFLKMIYKKMVYRTIIYSPRITVTENLPVLCRWKTWIWLLSWSQRKPLWLSMGHTGGLGWWSGSRCGESQLCYSYVVTPSWLWLISAYECTCVNLLHCLHVYYAYYSLGLKSMGCVWSTGRSVSLQTVIMFFHHVCVAWC